jgi:uroporphyrinogen-III synthase
MRLLVTRPAADATVLADRLRAAGHEVLVDPIIEIRERTDATLDLDGVTGLLFTSANGARAFAALSARRDLAVFAVGDHTATVARAAGFVTIESADGDVAALVRLVGARRKPEDGVLLHVSGTVTIGELAETLGVAGYNVRQAALYEAEPAAAFDETTRAALAAGTIDGVLLFSPRTARHFAVLIDSTSLGTKIATLTAWCLSKPVADALAPLSLRALRVAPKPTQDALLDLIAQEGNGMSAAPEASNEPAPARRRSTLPLLAALTVVILVAAGGWWAYPQIERWVESAEVARGPSVMPVPEPAVPDSLRPRVDRLDAALGGLASKDALDHDVAALGQRLAALEAQSPQDAGATSPDLSQDLEHLSAELTRLSQRVASLEARIERRSEAARGDLAMVLAAGQIRTAIAASAPFGAPVALIRATTPEDAAIEAPLAALEAHAKTGIASLAVLRQGLAALPEHLADPKPVPADAGFWDRVTARLGSLVRVRRIDNGVGDDQAPAGPDRLIADAQAELAAGDLAGAVSAIGGLTGRAADAAKPWLASAQARIDCEQAAAAIETALSRRLGTSQAAP